MFATHLLDTVLSDRFTLPAVVHDNPQAKQNMTILFEDIVRFLKSYAEVLDIDASSVTDQLVEHGMDGRFCSFEPRPSVEVAKGMLDNANQLLARADAIASQYVFESKIISEIQAKKADLQTIKKEISTFIRQEETGEPSSADIYNEMLMKMIADRFR